MDDWEKFNEASLPEKDIFHSNLNIEGITDADYTEEKKVCKDFEIKKLGEYHDLNVHIDTVLQADVLKNFWNIYLKINELDPAHFFSAPELAWQAALKKLKVKLDLLIDMNLLLPVEKDIADGIQRQI